MTKELIEQTFRAAVDVIFRMWNKDEIDATEAQVRLDHAREICKREYMKVLGLRAPVDGGK